MTYGGNNFSDFFRTNFMQLKGQIGTILVLTSYWRIRGKVPETAYISLQLYEKI